MRLMERRGGRETEGEKKSLGLLLKPSSCAVRGSEMSDCTAGLLVFRECFAAFRDLISHCLRRRAASRCHRYFPPLSLVHPHSLLPESESEGRRIAGQEGETEHTCSPPPPTKTSVRICSFLSLPLLPTSHSFFCGGKKIEKPTS